MRRLKGPFTQLPFSSGATFEHLRNMPLPFVAGFEPFGFYKNLSGGMNRKADQNYSSHAAFGKTPTRSLLTSVPRNKELYRKQSLAVSIFTRLK